MINTFMNEIDNCISQNNSIVIQIWEHDVLVIGKETEIDFYSINDNEHLELYDYNGQVVTIPLNELQYDEGEMVYWFNLIRNLDRLSMRIFF